MSNEFVTGDSRTKLVQLKINNATFAIDPGSMVKAQIVSEDKSKILTLNPVTCSATNHGADWTKSLVAVKFPRESTSEIRVNGKPLAANLELQVTLDPISYPEDLTFYLPIVIIKGNLE